jgi:hypothetical protein
MKPIKERAMREHWQEDQAWSNMFIPHIKMASQEQAPENVR